MGPSIRAGTGVVTQRSHVLWTSYTAVFPYYQFTPSAQSRVLVCSCPTNSLLLGNRAVSHGGAACRLSWKWCRASRGCAQPECLFSCGSPVFLSFQSVFIQWTKLKWGGIKGWGRSSDVLNLSWCRWPTTARRRARLGRRRRTTKATTRTRSACPSSSSSQRRGRQEEPRWRREQDWEISSVHQWTNAVVQCVLYLFAVSWAMSCWSLLFWTQVPFSSSAVLWHFCVIPSFPVGVPWIFLFLFESLINLLCNFRWASFSCKFQHLA